MTTETDFKEIYDNYWSECPEPEILPYGTWRLVFRSAKLVTAKEAGKSDRVLFFYGVDKPLGDVNDKATLKALQDSGYDWEENNPISHGFFFGSGADRRKVAQHIALHGIHVPPGVAPDADFFTTGTVNKLLKGKAVRAKLSEETYNSVTRNCVESFSAE